MSTKTEEKNIKKKREEVHCYPKWQSFDKFTRVI